jgi:hypothetical protein
MNFLKHQLQKKNNNSKITANTIEVIKNTKFNINLKESILNNIEIFNIFCDDKDFVPYCCTNDILENVIKNCGTKVGIDILKEIKNKFLNENIYNFIK